VGKHLLEPEDRSEAWPGNEQFVASDTPSADYARLQKVAYAAAHEVYPQVTILGFNTYGAENGTKWTKEVLDLGGIDTCDVVSYHDYESTMTGYPATPRRRLQGGDGPISDKLGRVPKPVWMSEGAPMSGDVSNGFYRCTLPYENGSDNWRIADRLARYVISAAPPGEACVPVHDARHQHVRRVGGMDHSGHGRWLPAPICRAHSELAWLLEDTDYARCVTLAEGIYAYVFAGPDRAVALSHPGRRTPHTHCRSRRLAVARPVRKPLAAGAALTTM